MQQAFDAAQLRAAGVGSPETRDDGRNIDREIGVLSGEGSSQATLGSKYDLEVQAFPYVPAQQDRHNPSYYDVPMLKQPVWIWSIPLYFYVGGVAGVAATFGAAMQIAAPRSMRSLVVRSRWVATLGGALSSALLIYDLGRPERFLNMLRVFRIASPMSMGSWILTCFSTCSGAAAVLPLGRRIFRPVAEAAGIVAGLFGLGLSGYTGVLLAQTAVPIWNESYRTLPVLFLASGGAAAASFFELFSLTHEEEKAVERFGAMVKLVELGAAFALQKDAARFERASRPLRQGFSGTLWKAGKLLSAVNLGISLLPGKSRPVRVTAGILGSVASLCVRFGIFYAGKACARDPRASFETQHLRRAAAVGQLTGN